MLTGAGISTESGIPDFRGPNGVWTKDPAAQRMFTLDAYVADPALRVRAWRSRLEHAAWTAEPNAGHLALVDLERRGLLHTLVTQNIDGLHQKAGNDPAKVVEMHGTLFAVECLGCGARTSMAAAVDRVRAGEEDPPCLACGGILKSATVSFGQSLDPANVSRARAAAEECDVFLAVGTSLTVHPVAALAPLAKRAGARLVIVNAEPTPYDGIADEVVRAPIGEALPRLVGAA
ncbi:MAG TPA: Sir2 family NAD-dependent protein deacetylase [Mycobacteriales bacterium]